MPFYGVFGAVATFFPSPCYWGYFGRFSPVLLGVNVSKFASGFRFSFFGCVPTPKRVVFWWFLGCCRGIPHNTQLNQNTGDLDGNTGQPEHRTKPPCKVQRKQPPTGADFVPVWVDCVQPLQRVSRFPTKPQRVRTFPKLGKPQREKGLHPTGKPEKVTRIYARTARYNVYALR